MDMHEDSRARRARRRTTAVALALAGALAATLAASAATRSGAAPATAAGATEPRRAAPATAGTTATDGCAQAWCRDDAVFQLSPLQSLVAGVLESPFTFADALALGDFGMGGMSPLEGEAVVVDGRAWLARVDGSLREVAPTERTSVLFGKRFRADRTVALPAIRGYDGLVAALDAETPRRNRIQAVRIDGRFARLTLRSVPRQSPPYVSVNEVVKTQQLQRLADVEGTLVGFRFPAYVGGINAPAWHFHFVDRARTRGGHVLEVDGDALRAQLDESRALVLAVPDDAAFDAADLGSGGDGFQPAMREGAAPAGGR